MSQRSEIDYHHNQRTILGRRPICDGQKVIIKIDVKLKDPIVQPYLSYNESFLIR